MKKKTPCHIRVTREHRKETLKPTRDSMNNSAQVKTDSYIPGPRLLRCWNLEFFLSVSQKESDGAHVRGSTVDIKKSEFLGVVKTLKLIHNVSCVVQFLGGVKRHVNSGALMRYSLKVLGSH